jgi:hypothetical protein
MKSSLSTRTYRSRGFAVINAMLGVLLPGLTIVTILTQPTSRSIGALERGFAIVLVVAAAVFMVARVARARLCVVAGGVKVVNPLRSRFVSWEDIAGFSLRPWRIFFTPVGQVDLNDGTSVPILGIQRSSPQIWRYRTPAEDMIDELNRLLEQFQTEQGG